MSVGQEEQTREGIARVCRYYLGPPVSGKDTRLIFVCPSCEGASFAVNLVTWKAGCWTGRCPPGRYADALELISHFEGLTSPPEILERAGEILALRVVETPCCEKDATDRADTESRCRETAHSEHGTQSTAGPPREQKPGETSSGTEAGEGRGEDADAAIGGLARARVQESGDELGTTEEGWYAVLIAPEGTFARPKIYRPSGAMRPLPSSVATGSELLVALVIFGVVAACAWAAAGHAAPPLYAAGLPEAAGVLVRHGVACALSAGAAVSLAAWILLSSRRHAERRHLGDDRKGPQAKATEAGSPPVRKTTQRSWLSKGGEEG